VAVWTGIECEGRLEGIPTLFVRDEACLTDEQWDARPHVYFNPPTTPTRERIRVQYLLAEEGLERGKLVSVVVPLDALAGLPNRLLREAHLVIDLPPASSLHLVKPTDELRFGLDTSPRLAPLRVFAETPSDGYDGDQPWKEPEC
jgi:hypothetical protein